MRNTLLMISAVSVTLAVGGCSLLNSGPPRDSEGRVTQSVTISAQDLQSGDCFTFNSADGSVVEKVTVMPCTEKHDYLIIGQGKLTSKAVAAAGSLQNAVSAACAPVFDIFKASVKGDTRPKQEFLVFPETDEPDSDQLYSCMSTDPDQDYVPPSPTPTPGQTPES